MPGHNEPRAAVATGHPVTTEAAVSVLRSGGNAFDAAVAAGFASAVTEPVLTSLGGGGFFLARSATGEETLYDFFVDTPGRGLSTPPAPEMTPVTVEFGSSDQEFHIGLGSVAVPGNIAGFLYVHRALGRLPLGDVVAPAVAMARDGVVMTATQAYLVQLVAPILTFTDAGRRLYAPQGRPLRQGERFRNPELADFMETLTRTGGNELYGGTIADTIDADMRNGNGALTAADLAAYTVIERQPLAVTYRGHRVLTNPAPSFGGTLIANALRILEGQEIRRAPWGNPAHLKALVTTMVEVDRRRAGSGPSTPHTSKGTTHLSVIDADGNVASMTTSNGEGSGYIVPGTGMMLNNMMGEDDLHPHGFQPVAPGQRVASMMSPSILVCDDDPVIAVGSGGSKRIRTALFQLMSHILDFDFGLREAVEAPRLHWDGEMLQIEPGFAEETLTALAREWTINRWPEKNVYFGGAHAASSAPQAASDPRRGGCALIVEE